MTTETMNDTERRILAILAEATTEGFMPWAVIRDKLPPPDSGGGSMHWTRCTRAVPWRSSEAVAGRTSASPMRSPERRTGHRGRAVPWCSPDWPILERNER